MHHLHFFDIQLLYRKIEYLFLENCIHPQLSYNLDNELYIIKPLVIWNYNPSLGGEMYREMRVFDDNYLNEIEVYYPHAYEKR